MKRSEAIEKLTDDLMCYYDDCEEARFYAKSFLSSVEDLGMLPPCNFKTQVKDVSVRNIKAWSWEPEDD